MSTSTRVCAGKRRFESVAAATEAMIAELRDATPYDVKPTPTGSYPCRVCGGAHWTSGTRKPWAAGKGGRKNPKQRTRRRRR